jgi:hypothetical protein
MHRILRVDTLSIHTYDSLKSLLLWVLEQPKSPLRLFLWWSKMSQRNFSWNKMTIRQVPRRSVQKNWGLCGQLYISKGLIPLLKSWFVQSLVRLHFQPDHNIPEHCQHGNPSACTVRRDIYDVYVPLLLPPMLCVGCTTIASGNHCAQWLHFVTEIVV